MSILDVIHLSHSDLLLHPFLPHPVPCEADLYGLYQWIPLVFGFCLGSTKGRILWIKFCAPPPARFICWIEAPVLQSGTLFGSKITADIINEDEVIWVIQSSEIGVLIKRGNLDTDTHENAMWRWGQRWGYCFSKPSNTKSAREPLEASREAWTDSSPQLSEGTNPNDAWTSSLQSRETGHFCGLSHQLCSPLLRQC